MSASETPNSRAIPTAASTSHSAQHHNGDAGNHHADVQHRALSIGSCPVGGVRLSEFGYGFPSLPSRGPNHRDGIGDRTDHQNEPVDPRQHTIGRQHPQQDRGGRHHRQLEAKRPHLDGQRQYQCAEAEHEQHVDDVRAGDVADRKRTAALRRGNDTHGKFGMLVPIDTTVRPTTIGLIPSRDAALALPLTITSAPTTRAPKPAKNHAALANTTSSVDSCHAKRDANVPYHPRFWRFVERYGTFAPHNPTLAHEKAPGDTGGLLVWTSGRSYR